MPVKYCCCIYYCIIIYYCWTINDMGSGTNLQVNLKIRCNLLWLWRLNLRLLGNLLMTSAEWVKICIKVSLRSWLAVTFCIEEKQIISSLLKFHLLIRT